jgi:hypothetical protein
MNENEMEWNETESNFLNREPTNELDGSNSDGSAVFFIAKIKYIHFKNL